MNFNYPNGATPLRPEEQTALKPGHITTQKELNAWEERNIITALPWAFEQKNILTISFIKELHARMFDQTWKWAGKFRNYNLELNIGNTPWFQVPLKIQQLCNNVLYQIEHETFSRDEIAIRFHRDLVWIHAFPNGNGRHTRLIADLLIMQQGFNRFTWGMNQNLYDESPIRKDYIAALMLADKGDYSKLLEFARS